MEQIRHYVTNSNLSEAWLEVFRQLTEPGVEKISPLVVAITGIINGQAAEDYTIRRELDATLEERDESVCQTVAGTIFPNSLWNKKMSREILFNRYMHILPRVRKVRANMYGVYFERLIAFGAREGKGPVNQLEHIIQTYARENHRHSALQAAIFDPHHDHSHQRQRGFPCLQQVAFDANYRTKELAVIGFYAKQYIFEKAYGNYLGLCALGKFMAHEMGLELKQVTCIASVAELGRISKTEARNFLQKLCGAE